MTARVFISHASSNAELALRICKGLESTGLPCWIAPRDVRFDGTYGTEIINGLRECDVFLIVITDAAAESEQVEREAERASHYKKRIIPVIVGRSEPSPRLEFYVAGRQHFVCSSVPDERFLNDLGKAIRGQASTSTTPAPPPPASHPPRPNDPSAHYYYGKVMKLVGRTEEDRKLADEAFQRAIQFDHRERNYGAHFYRALTLIDQKNPGLDSEIGKELQAYMMASMRFASDEASMANALPPTSTTCTTT